MSQVLPPGCPGLGDDRQQAFLIAGQCVGRVIAKWEAGRWPDMSPILSTPDGHQKWVYAQLSLGQKLSLVAWNPAVRYYI